VLPKNENYQASKGVKLMIWNELIYITGTYHNNSNQPISFLFIYSLDPTLMSYQLLTSQINSYMFDFTFLPVNNTIVILQYSNEGFFDKNGEATYIVFYRYNVNTTYYDVDKAIAVAQTGSLNRARAIVFLNEIFYVSGSSEDFLPGSEIAFIAKYTWRVIPKTPEETPAPEEPPFFDLITIIALSATALGGLILGALIFGRKSKPKANLNETKDDIKKSEIKSEVKPEVIKSESKKPVENKPEVKKPDLKKPVENKSEVKKPEVKKPEVKKPEVKKPEVKDMKK
jgi:hypothetical protein